MNHEVAYHTSVVRLLLKRVKLGIGILAVLGMGARLLPGRDIHVRAYEGHLRNNT